MKGRHVLLGAATVATAVRGLLGCSFGPSAYTGPAPLTPEEAGLAVETDDGESEGGGSGSDATSGNTSTTDASVGDSSVDGGSKDQSAPGDSKAADGAAGDASTGDGSMIREDSPSALDAAVDSTSG
jgi:hypothetical protein